MTGLTLPGMIDEPGCMGGRLISLRPQRGPEDIQRRSLQILEIWTAARFMVPAICANDPESCVASTRFVAFFSGSPVASARRFVTKSAYPGGLLMPVPIAVAPMFRS